MDLPCPVGVRLAIRTSYTHLAEESDLGFDGGSHLRVELIEVDRSLVRQMVKDVERLGRSIKVRMGWEIVGR